MLSPADLILSTGTIGNPPIRLLLEAARAGGYAGITCWPQDYRQWRADGISDSEARSRCEEAGVQISHIDCLLRWMRAGASASEEEEIFSVAERLGATSVGAIGPAIATPADDLAERFAAVCDRAAGHGLRVALEVSPWKHTLDLEGARRMIERVARPNAALIIDSWHMFRGGVAYDDLARLPAAMVGSVQISDAPNEPGEDLPTETMQSRLLPGRGDADVAGFLNALHQAGVREPLTVEVLSNELAQRGPISAARDAAAATRAVLESSTCRWLDP